MSIKFDPIFHVGYAVPDMGKALDYWTKVMGVGPFFLERHITGNDEEYIYKGHRCEANDDIRAKFGKLKKFSNEWDGSEPIRGKA